MQTQAADPEGHGTMTLQVLCVSDQGLDKEETDAAALPPPVHHTPLRPFTTSSCYCCCGYIFGYEELNNCLGNY